MNDSPRSDNKHEQTPHSHRERDYRLDFVRGLALIAIFIDHIPGNPAAWLTLRNFAFCDAAEVFVLVSGISSYLAYGKKLDRLGLVGCWHAVARRWLAIYMAHIVLFLAIAAGTSAISAHFCGADYIGFLRPEWFFKNPKTAVEAAPSYSDTCQPILIFFRYAFCS
jgi:hypothetical protein